MTRLKHVAALIAGQSPPSEDVGLLGDGQPFLQGNAEFGSVHPTPRYECSAPPKQCEPGDILLSVRAPVGAVNVADRAYGIGRGLCAIRSHAAATDYLKWWLLHCRAELEVLATGSTFAAVSTSVVGGLEVPVVDSSHQRTIADYLDRETARIDTLIEEQRRLIEMLRERRHALRVNAALHGTTHAPKAESSLPWANELPAHWSIVPLTSVAQLESGHTPSRSRDDWWTDAYIPWVSLHDVGNMRGLKVLDDTTQHISDAGIANSSARVLPARTVVLSRDATVGRTAIMGVPMATSQHFAAWVCGPLLDPEYLWVLFADAMQPFFASFQNGSTIRTIGMGDLKAFRIPLPPLDEQRQIVKDLDQETPKIDALIAESQRFIELSRERRAALITAAVTGQVDVREVV